MNTVKEILTKNRKDIIDLLKDLMPTVDIVKNMGLFLNYCVENNLNEQSNVYDFITNFYYFQIKNGVPPMPKPVSTDINDTMKTIRTNTRKNWGI